MLLIKPVISVPGKHVDMEMPHVLVTRRFIVLARRHTLAAVRQTHGPRYLLRQVPDRVAVRGFHLVEVLHVTSGHDQGAARIGWPPLRSNAGVRTVGDGDHITCLVVIVEDAILEAAEGAFVTGRLVGRKSHPRMLPPRTRARSCGGSLLRFDEGQALLRAPFIRVVAPESPQPYFVVDDAQIEALRVRRIGT
jgi:hypothetical protein